MSVNKKIIETEAAEYDFGVTTYTGNGSTNSITTGFQSDVVFLRNADNSQAYAAGLFDTTRGATKLLNANSTDAETTDTTSLTSFDSGGFTLGSGGDFNANGSTFSSFSLKAAGGTTSTGSGTGGVTSVATQVNSAAGFSLIQFVEGTGTSSTVNHELSSTPELMISKKRGTNGQAWFVWHKDLSTNQFLSLNARNGASTSASPWGSNPDSTKINFGPWQTETDDYGAQTRCVYSFHSVSGYSKIDSYTGNASTNAITVGFLPKFLMVKKIDNFGTWYFWLASGMTSQSYGYSGNSGIAISSTGTLPSVEFRSDNGGQFVLSGSDYNVNASSATFIYWCVGGDKTNVL